MTVRETFEQPAIDMRNAARFIELARRGKHRGASGGEKASRALALAIVDSASALSCGAIDGAVEFLRAAAMRPTTARELIEG